MSQTILATAIDTRTDEPTEIVISCPEDLSREDATDLLDEVDPDLRRFTISDSRLGNWAVQRVGMRMWVLTRR